MNRGLATPRSHLTRFFLSLDTRSGRAPRLACEARAVKKAAPPPVEEENSTIPTTVAIGAPIAALAASAAAVGSGSLPKDAFEGQSPWGQYTREQRRDHAAQTRVRTTIHSMLSQARSSASPAAYLHATAQFVFDATAAGQVPEFVSHWFHAINMVRGPARP